MVGGGGGSLGSDNFKMCEISVSFLVGPGAYLKLQICGFNILVRVTDLWV